MLYQNPSNTAIFDERSAVTQLSECSYFPTATVQNDGAQNTWSFRRRRLECLRRYADRADDREPVPRFRARRAGPMRMQQNGTAGAAIAELVVIAPLLLLVLLGIRSRPAGPGTSP